MTSPDGTGPSQADVYAAALELHAAGFCVIPARTDGTKAPAGNWRQFMDVRPSLDDLRSWFSPEAGASLPGLGLVCGAVSGQLVMVEAEAAATTEAMHLGEVAQASGLGPLWERVWGGWAEATPSGGLHLYVRCTDAVAGNTKLAKGADGRATLAETRGQGGFTVVAPSHGSVHPTGKAWRRLWGGPASCPVLTPDELQAVLTLFATLDQAPPAAPFTTTAPPLPGAGPVSTADAFLAGPSGGARSGGLSPGDDFEARTTWADLLVPQGWSVVMQRGSTTYWRRPGKTLGISATTGHAADRDRLYVFTSSTELPTEQPLTRFGAYALLHHGGDFRAAARQLRAEGYGEPLAPPTAPPRLQLVQGMSGAEVARAEAEGAVQAQAGAAPARVTSARKYDVALTDAGNAELFARQHGHRLRYVIQRQSWLVWDDTPGAQRWVEDTGSLRAVDLMRRVLLELPEAGLDDMAHRHRSLSRRGVHDALTLARSLPGIGVDVVDLNADPMVLGVPGGLVDLASGDLRAPDPAALVTLSASVAPDADCPTPRWDAFLADTFDGRDEVAAYVQRLAGYFLTGKVSHQLLAFLHGPGANGKSVLAGVLRRILGDYAAQAPAGFLMAGLQQHPTELAMLHGRRLLIASEVDPRARFDEQRVKDLTGGEPITARYMRGDFFTFPATAKMLLIGNHLPAVSTGGDSLWRRMRLIGCGHVVPAERRVADLDALLVQQEGPGILAWMLAGLEQLQQHGLSTPESVRVDTEAYAAEEDHLAQYLAEACRIGGGKAVTAEVPRLRADYEAWCHGEGHQPLNAVGLGRELRRHGVSKLRTNGRNVYTNISLLDGHGQ